MVPTASMRTVSPARRIHSPTSAAARLCSGDRNRRVSLSGLGADRRQRVDHGLRPLAEASRVGCAHDWTRSSMRKPMMRPTSERHGQLRLRVALDALGEGGEDRLLVGAAHGQDEGKAEPGACRPR